MASRLSAFVQALGLLVRDLLNKRDARIAVIDLEASALGSGSYPIEVGIAVVQGGSSSIETWSSIIEPTEAWLTRGRWSEQSAAVHGLALSTIVEEGAPAHVICEWLNATLGAAAVVASDAPRYDQDWLDTLFSAARLEQRFALYSLEILTVAFNADQHRHLSYLLSRSRPPHRAGPDALRLASAVLETHLGFPPHEKDHGSPFDRKECG